VIWNRKKLAQENQQLAAQESTMMEGS